MMMKTLLFIASAALVCGQGARLIAPFNVVTGTTPRFNVASSGRAMFTAPATGTTYAVGITDTTGAPGINFFGTASAKVGSLSSGATAALGVQDSADTFRFLVFQTGVVQIPGLGGGGTQYVQVDNSGNLSGTGGVFVTTNTIQTITATKTFTADQNFNNIFFNANNLYDVGTTAVAARNMFSRINSTEDLLLGVASTNFGTHWDLVATSPAAVNHLLIKDAAATTVLDIVGTGTRQFSFLGSLLPATTNTYPLGGSSNEWAAVYSPSILTYGASAMNVGTFSAQPLELVTNGSEHARISATGNFGIGDTNPLQPLVVSGASSGTNYILKINDTNNAPGFNFYRSGVKASSFSAGATAAFSIQDQSDTFRTILLQTGRQLWGRTSEDGSAAILQVQALTGAPGLSIQNVSCDRIVLGSGAGIYSGAGFPNGSCSASPGAIFLSTAGGAATTLWVKESGAGTNTGWVGK